MQVKDVIRFDSSVSTFVQWNGCIAFLAFRLSEIHPECDKVILQVQLGSLCRTGGGTVAMWNGPKSPLVIPFAHTTARSKFRWIAGEWSVEGISSVSSFRHLPPAIYTPRLLSLLWRRWLVFSSVLPHFDFSFTPSWVLFNQQRFLRLKVLFLPVNTAMGDFAEKFQPSLILGLFLNFLVEIWCH